MGRQVDVSVLQVAVSTWARMNQLQVRMSDLIEVLQRGVELAGDDDDQGKMGDEWMYPELPPETDNDDTPVKAKPMRAEQAERDDRGRKVITRDHSWRDKTLATVRAAGTSGATVEALAAQLQVSGGALQMRLARLRRDGLVERVNRSWRMVEVAL
jgi:hypothetical protein